MRTVLPAFLCLALLHAAPAAAQEPALPSLAQLEAQGALIGEIHINPQNIFDLSDPHEDYLLARVANAIHVVTRETQVRRTLLFKSGERLSVRLIEETERLLRSTIQVYSANIRPVAYENGVVDLAVVTRDRWTLDVSASISRTGGVNAGRFSIKEANLFGTGTSLGVTRSSNVDRTSDTISISHPHAFGPFVAANYAYSDTSDGRNWAASVNRPFYALDTRDTWGIATDSSVRNEAVYVSGINTGTYRHEQSNGNAFTGWSSGLIDGWTRRHTIGYSYQDNYYTRVPGESPEGGLPSDLTLSGPYYRFQVVQDRFRTGSNYDSIGKPEDINVGLNFNAQLGRSITALGSTRQQWLYNTTVAYGADIGERGLLLTNAELSGRYASAGEQQLSKLEARYFLRQANKFTFYGTFGGSMVRNPDVPNPLTLGGDNDLRGYPLRYQSGNKAVLLNLEERLYTDWNPFRLLRVGAAVFYDGGRAWGGSNPNIANPGWLNDVGFGLRFLTDRSAVGNVLHIDIAFPLNREPGIDPVQLLVYTKVTL